MAHKYESQPGAKKRVAIVGARGYSGLELARILLKHPAVELAACFAGETAFKLADFLPEKAAGSVPVLPLSQMAAELPKLDCVFLATPTEVSLELAPQILAHTSAIDLSGAFRLQAGTPGARFKEWYKLEHKETALLQKASYGLQPFAALPQAAKQLVSNPGCYATAIMMALVPLLKAGVIEADSIAIDAKSGTSGAGRKAAEGQLFMEVAEDCLPYRVGKHQHLPEIQEWTEKFSGVAIDPFFVTHLLPVRRGITAAIFATLKTDAAKVAEAFAKAYADYPLVRVNAGAKALSLKMVAGSARTHIAYTVEGKKLYLFSMIDNLLKGAASQAVENFNAMNGLPVALALEEMEGNL